MRKIFSALDIGSSSIKLIVAELIENKINILFSSKKENSGFKYSAITDKTLLINNIKTLLDKAEKKLNFKIKKIILNIPTEYNEFHVVDYQINIDTEDNKINSNHILKVLKESTINKYNPNEEMISNIPIIFKVGDNETDKPYGKIGSTLSLKSVIITTSKRKVYDFVRLFENLDIEIIDITTTGLVDYYNFKNDELDEKNVIIVNLGDTSTNISIYSKGIYINNQTLEIGGLDIDREIAQEFNVGKSDAIYLKENLAYASLDNADIKEKIEITTKDGEKILVNQYEISKIVNNKLVELLKNIKNTVNHLTKKQISYIIITGGLTEIKDFSLVLNSIFGKKGKKGNINIIGARDNCYSVTIGMLKYFNEKLSLRNKDYSSVTAEDIESMMSNDSKNAVTNDSIIGKVFSYFFDN